MSEAVELYPRDIVDSPRPAYNLVLVSALGNLEDYLQEAQTNPDQRVLYEEQVPVMEDLYTHLKEYGMDLRGRIVVPTGVGKTVLFTEFVKATGLRTLILTPTKLLLQQTEAAFEKFAGDEEISVGKVYSGEKNGDEPITITTYASFVKHTKDKDSPHINPANYDLIILDEAHRALSEGTQAALKEYPDAVQIGFTATEKFSERRQLSTVLPHEIHRMDIQEAVGSGLVSPFSVWVVETGTDMSSVRITSTNEYDHEDLQATLNTETRNQVAVELYIRHFADQKAIFACSGVEHAKTMATMLEENGIPAIAIHGGLTLKQQREIKARFADADPSTGLMVLCNDKILSEGFDEPQVGACFNLAPTLSYIRSQQRSGRALRINPEDPGKHAIIVEFVDKNYQKPPVLFADTEVAGAAHLGADLDHNLFSQTFDFNLATATLITDPLEVAELAVTFSEGRKASHSIAPEGWLTLSGLVTALNSSSATVYSKLRFIKEHIPELCETDMGKFLSSGIKGGVTTHYSPIFRKNLEVLILPPDVAPPDWMTAAQIAARYGVKSGSLSIKLNNESSQRKDYSGKFVIKDGDAIKRKFFSPECIRNVVESQGLAYLGNAPPPKWKSRAELCALFGEDAVDYVFSLFEKSNRANIYNHTMSNEDLGQFVSPSFVNSIERTLEPPRGWVTLDEITAELMITKEDAQVYMDMIRKGRPPRAGSDFRYGFVGNGVIEHFPFYYPYTIRRMLEESEQENTREEDLGRAVDKEPREFTNNQVVLIPHFVPAKAPRIEKKDVFSDIEFEDIAPSLPTSVNQKEPTKQDQDQQQTNIETKNRKHKTMSSEQTEQSKDSGLLQQTGTSSVKHTGQRFTNSAQSTSTSYLGAIKRFKR